MKRRSILIIALALVLVLSACAVGCADRGDISRRQAIQLALDEAGLERSEVRDLEAELDREREGLYWEVDFETPQHEFSYDIHVDSGEIRRVERERKG
ncbi:MAG: PepSY domain-containing protein [Clostridia bacterium]|nr:PepSY domain-containing protein [Clostridia bacterium]